MATHGPLKAADVSSTLTSPFVVPYSSGEEARLSTDGGGFNSLRDRYL